MITGTVALNRVFNKSVFANLMQGDLNDVFRKCLNHSVDERHAKNNYERIEQIYDYLSEHHRNEYFYKNTLLNKLLLGRHSVNTTTALSELPVSQSIADFVLINGRATVYEIKTELDTLARLDSQLHDYYKVFNKVYVLTSESNELELQNALSHTDVGIIVLTNRVTLSERKEAPENNDYLDYTTMFKVLRKYEYENILLHYYGYLPETTQVRYFTTCLNMFKEIPMNDAHHLFINELRGRDIKEKNEFLSVPYELKYLAYFSRFKQEDYVKLREFLFS